MVINKAVLTYLFLAASYAASAAEPQVLMHIVWPFDRGSVEVKMVAEPPLKNPKEFLGPFKYGGRGDTFIHAIRDPQSQRSFGYELRVKPLKSDLYEVVIGPPVSPKPNGRQLEVFSGDLSNPVLPKYPKPQRVHDGDTIALDLLVNPETGQKIVDYIRVSSERKELLFRGWQDPDKQPRDFTMDDVWLQFYNSSLTINGQPFAGNFCVGSWGGMVWFDLEGKGRYILSIMPHEGYDFRKGVIRDNLVSFDLGSDKYEIRTSGSILRNDEPFTIYALNDPSFPGKGGICGGANTVAEALARPRSTPPSSVLCDTQVLRVEQATKDGKVQVTGQNVSSGLIVAYVVVVETDVNGAHQRVLWSKSSTGATIGVGKTVTLGDMPANSDLTQAHVFVNYVRLADGTSWGEAKTDQAKEMAAHSDLVGGPFRSGAGPQAVPVGPPPTPRAPKP